MTGPGARGEATNLFDALRDAAARHGDREFLVIGRRDETISFAGLAERAEAFGRMLVRQGVRPGDRLALWMTNRVDWAVAAFGAARCGAVLVALNTRLSAREVAHMLRLTAPKVWALEDVFLGKIDAAEKIAPVLEELRAEGAALPKVLLLSAGAPVAGTIGWAEAVAEAAGDPAPPPAAVLVARSGEAEPELGGVAAILSTSGTTAAPKGVMLGHDNLLWLAGAVAERQTLTPADRFFSISPFFHCAGYMHGLLANLLSGSTLFITQAYRAEDAWEIIKGERITLYHGFSLPMQEMERLPQFDPAAIPSLTRAWFGGVPEELARIERVYGTRICEIYGLTETGGCSSICRTGDPTEMRHDSDGTPFAGVEVRIIDPATGADQPDGTPGEILVRGPNVMRGYFRDPAATAKTIDAEGWLHTGDQGMKRSNGFIKWLSRLKDMIRVGGENLSPLEVEAVLLTHPAVAQVAVVAAPHPRLGETPVAFLMVRGDAPDAQALDAYCRARLANFKVPSRFIVMDDFPRTTATMRVQKAKLREMLMAEANG